MREQGDDGCWQFATAKLAWQRLAEKRDDTDSRYCGEIDFYNIVRVDGRERHTGLEAREGSQIFHDQSTDNSILRQYIPPIQREKSETFDARCQKVRTQLATKQLRRGRFPDSGRNHNV